MGPTPTPSPAEDVEPTTALRPIDPSKGWLFVVCPLCSAPVGQNCNSGKGLSRWCVPHNKRRLLALNTRRKELAQALATLDGPTPCAASVERDAWTSEDGELRAIAALYCEPCPIVEVCRRTGQANRESFVWGGLDLGNRPHEVGAFPD